jgi:hypothetical protein
VEATAGFWRAGLWLVVPGGPSETANDKIDFALVENMINAPVINWEKPPYAGDHFIFDSSRLIDSVIVPSYYPLGMALHCCNIPLSMFSPSASSVHIVIYLLPYFQSVSSSKNQPKWW